MVSTHPLSCTLYTGSPSATHKPVLSSPIEPQYEGWRMSPVTRGPSSFKTVVEHWQGNGTSYTAARRRGIASSNTSCVRGWDWRWGVSNVGTAVEREGRERRRRGNEKARDDAWLSCHISLAFPRSRTNTSPSISMLPPLTHTHTHLSLSLSLLRSLTLLCHFLSPLANGPENGPEVT